MTKSNYWIERPVSNSSNGHAGVHQASKDFIIIVSDSADFSPSMEVCVGRADCFSIQVPRSTKTHKVNRVREDDFLQYFNQTMATFRRLDPGGGEYYIDTEDYSECYQLEAFYEKPHIQLSLHLEHSVRMTNCSIDVSHSFSRRPGIRRNYVPISESAFRQAYGLMLEFCSDRDAYNRFQDKLFAQVQALLCKGKPVGGLALDAGMYFDKAREEMLDRRKSIELRLVSADEPPQKRRELRAEMRGIDFCVSVLDSRRSL